MESILLGMADAFVPGDPGIFVLRTWDLGVVWQGTESGGSLSRLAAIP